MDAEQQECTNCIEQEAAIARCTNCEVFLCEECARQHKRQRATADHRVVESEDAVKIRERYKCIEHDLELKYYCCGCSKPVCQHCTMKGCQGHPLNVANDVRELLKASLSSLEEKASQFDSHFEHIKSVQQENDTATSRCEQDIDFAFRELTRQLQERKEQLVGELQQANAVQQGYIKEHEGFIEQKLKELRESIHTIEKVCASRQESKLMVERDELLAKASELSQLYWSTDKVNTTQWQIMSPPKDEYTRKFGHILPKPLPENIIVQMKESAVVGEQNEFSIRVEPKEQINTCHIDKEISAKLTLTLSAPLSQSQGTILSRKVKKVSENEWTVTYFPRARGVLSIAVSVCGVEAKGSSFEIQVEDRIKAGDKVVRGSDWKWEDQDGGSGNIGEVVAVKENGWISVRWSTNKKQVKEYRWGKDGKFDVSLCAQ